MELLETQDPDRKKLIESSENHKRALEKEFNQLSIKKDRMLTNALFIGGTLALTYLVIATLSKKRKKKKEKALKLDGSNDKTIVNNITEDEKDKTTSLLTQIGTSILTSASMMLLDLAREKLSEYLESRKHHDEPS